MKSNLPITRPLLSSLLWGRVTSDKVKLLKSIQHYPEVMFQIGMWLDLPPCSPFPVAASSSLEPGSRFAPASRKWDGLVMLWTKSGGSSPPDFLMWSVEDTTVMLCQFPWDPGRSFFRFLSSLELSPEVLTYPRDCCDSAVVDAMAKKMTQGRTEAV